MTPVTPSRSATAAAPDGDTEPELRRALRDAAAQVIIDRGLGAFSLREVARRAGVSHAAPGYHFGDTRGLLTSLAIEAFEVLYAELDAAAGSVTDARERLTAIGSAYVRVGLRHPAHMEVAFRDDLVDPDDPGLHLAGQRAFAVLQNTIAEIASAENPALDVRTASHLCWSAMQGLVALHPKIELLDAYDSLPATPIEQLVARFTTLLLSGLLHAEAT